MLLLRLLSRTLCFTCLFWLHLSINGQDPVKSIDWDVRDSDDFDSLSEFFTGEENQRGCMILRSCPDSREGLYFELKLAEKLSEWPKGVSAIVYYQSHEMTKPQPIIFQLPDHLIETHTLVLGLTGKDWSKSARLNAYKIEIVNEAGEILSTFKSFGWSAEAPL